MATTQSPAIDNGISPADRAHVVEGLSRALAENYSLYFMTHGFHWNVTGPMFQTLHLMFETQYNELWQATDLIAERIRALGSFAPATYAQLTELSSIDLPSGVPAALDMVRHLVKGHDTVSKHLRSTLPVAEKAADQATADLLTQRLQVHEKTAWMLRALLE